MIGLITLRHRKY